MNRIKVISTFLLAIFMITAGIMHFVNPHFYLKIMPPYLPLHKELVLVSGICEVLLGILLLVPNCSRLAAWGIIALLIAVFPANVYLVSASGHNASTACHSFSENSVAGSIHSLGVLAYKTGKEVTVNLKVRVNGSQCGHRFTVRCFS